MFLHFLFCFIHLPTTILHFLIETSSSNHFPSSLPISFLHACPVKHTSYLPSFPSFLTPTSILLFRLLFLMFSFQFVLHSILLYSYIYFSQQVFSITYSYFHPTLCTVLFSTSINIPFFSFSNAPRLNCHKMTSSVGSELLITKAGNSGIFATFFK